MTNTGKTRTEMLYQEMRTLADELAAGQVTSAEAAGALRRLSTHTPDESCRRMVSFSRYLARVDEAWSWSLIDDSDQNYGGPKLVSNRFTSHPSNMDTVIDFHWWTPADVDTLGRALCSVAESMAIRSDSDRENYGEDW